MTHDELIAAYGREYGLANCALDASGRLTLELSSDILVYIESHQEEHALVFTVPAVTVTKPSAELLTVLLGNNFFYRGAASNVTGYNAASGEVVVVRGVDTAEMTPAALDEVLVSLVEDTQYWRALVESGDAAWEGLTGSDGAPSTQVFNNLLNMA